jgi:hypothetical protein
MVVFEIKEIVLVATDCAPEVCQLYSVDKSIVRCLAQCMRQCLADSKDIVVKSVTTRSLA